jgi:hypothetical protein
MTLALKGQKPKAGGKKLRFTNTPKPHFHLIFQTKQPLAKGACPLVISHKFFCVGDRKVGNRPLGGCVGASRQLDRQNAPVKPKRHTFWAC